MDFVKLVVECQLELCFNNFPDDIERETDLSQKCINISLNILRLIDTYN